MNTTLQAPMVTAAYAELAAAGPQDHINRNTAIVLLHENGEEAKVIAAAAGIHADTARRIIRTFSPDMSVTFAIEENAREIADAEAEALETPASKAAATKARKAAEKQAAEDAEFEVPALVVHDPEGSDPAAELEGTEPVLPIEAKPIPKSAVLVEGVPFIRWTRTTRSGDHLTVAQPQAVGLDASEGKWLTKCEKHNEFTWSENQKAARSLAAAEFCDECREEQAGA